MKRGNNMNKRRLRIIAVPLLCWLIAISALQGMGRNQDKDNAHNEHTKQEVAQLADRLRQSVERFAGFFDPALAKSPVGGTSEEASLNERARNLKQTLKDLSEQLNIAKKYEDVDPQVADVLAQAETIDGAFRSIRLSAEADHIWDGVRADLNRLADIYHFRLLSWGPSYFEETRARVDTLIHNLEKSSDRFEKVFDKALDKSSIDETKTEGSLEDLMDDIEDELDRLRSDFDKTRLYQDTRPRVVRILALAERLNQLIKSIELNPGAEIEWKTFYTSLNQLTEIYYLRPLTA